MRFPHILSAVGLLTVLALPVFSAEPIPVPTVAPKGVVVRLNLKSDEKIRKDLAYYLKGELEIIEGVTVTESKDIAADYELDAMEVNEPLGRMALSISFTRAFNQKDNLAAYQKLMADHWKGGMKDETWTAFEDYFKPYGIVVSRQLLTGRRGKVRELCTSVAEAFAKDVLKRPLAVEAEPGEAAEKQ